MKKKAKDEREFKERDHDNKTTKTSYGKQKRKEKQGRKKGMRTRSARLNCRLLPSL